MSLLKKIIISVLLVLTAGIIIFVFYNYPDRKICVSRAAGYRQAAIILGIDENNEYNNYFNEFRDTYWFMKYINFLYEKEYIDEAFIKADCDLMSENITIAEAAHLINACKKDFTLEYKLMELENTAKKYNENNYTEISYEQWDKILELIENVYDRKGDIEEKELFVFATPAYVHSLKAWQAVTDKGIFEFEGYAADEFVDKKVRAVFVDDKLLKAEVISERAEYENAIIYQQGTMLKVMLEGVERNFVLNKALENEGYVLADINVKNGSITKIKLKNEKIKGAIHTIKDGYIDIEGYDKLKLHDNVHIFKTFGDTKELSMNDLMIEYDVYEFIVAENQICGIYMVREAEPDKIRVIISDYEIKSLYHNEVECSSESGLLISSGTETMVIGRGEKFLINRDSPYFANGRIVIRPMDAGSILISSIERKCGDALYPGSLELTLHDDGILVINELFIEDYLKRVVPSEMTAGSDLEALKVQAVCARSYAYRHIKSNSYAQLGAHVDDTTMFQVYNNRPMSENTDRAVDETAGKVLCYNDEPVTTYYYSTSCGYSTDVSIWGDDAAKTPYLAGIRLSDGDYTDVGNNDMFAAMIKSKDESDWESNYPWYRWNTTLDAGSLSEIINENISKYSLDKFEDVDVLQPDGSFTPQYVNSIGTVRNIEILERGRGGVVSMLLIQGSQNTVILNKAGAVRNVLGSSSTEYIRNDGSTAKGQRYLPSGFFTIDGVSENGELKELIISGGGFGHGIGMSQNAAEELAKQGKGYEEILQIFYPGTEVKDVSKD
ncbi:MAG: SpoIID/LytB domain-containing protein [Lachnospiraceae bacterium]|nr:SpoIID/LytB domain-containing protein [Lachnospiraceae bacterium]